MIDRMAHAGLRREMDHSWKAVFCEQRVPLTARSARSICTKREARLAAQDVQAGLLQRRIVIAVEIVQTDHGAAFGQQPAGDVEADETRSPVTNIA